MPPGKLASRWEQQANNNNNNASTPSSGGATTPTKKWGAGASSSSSPAAKKWGAASSHTTTSTTTPTKKNWGAASSHTPLTSSSSTSTPVVKKWGTPSTSSSSSSSPASTTTKKWGGTPASSSGGGGTSSPYNNSGGAAAFKTNASSKFSANRGRDSGSGSTSTSTPSWQNKSRSLSPTGGAGGGRSGGRKKGVVTAYGSQVSRESAMNKGETWSKEADAAKNASILDRGKLKGARGGRATTFGKDNEDDTSEEACWKRACESILSDKSLVDSKIQPLLQRMKAAGAFDTGRMRRAASIRDSELITLFSSVLANDPEVTQVSITKKDATLMRHVKAAKLVEFAHGIRRNLYLKKLVVTGVELDSAFLSALSASMEHNIALQEIDLSNNEFTNDSLSEFCQAMTCNTTCGKVNLTQQRSPVLTHSEEAVLAALEQNTTAMIQIEFKTKSLEKKLSEIHARNNNNNKVVTPGSAAFDKLLVELMEHEALHAEDMAAQNQLELEAETVQDSDWPYLIELSQLADKYRLNAHAGIEENELEIQKSKSNDSGDSSGGGGASAALAGAIRYTDDGSFLTNEFIDEYLQTDNDFEDTLIFAFQNQAKLFKRFPVGDPKRRFISEKFAQVLVNHPRAAEITHINMANCCCGDEWLAGLSKEAAAASASSSKMPRLHSLNMETNFVGEEGIVALSECCLANQKVWPMLQVLRLENQRHLISSKAEFALAKALCANRSVIRLSMRIRNLWERTQVEKFIQRNLDFVRQARLRHAIATGTHVERQRNDIEVFFDKIAANDANIQEVDLVGNQVFLSLPKEEVIKAGKAFKTNSHVTSVRMTLLKLDDDFACALAESIESNNTTLQKVILDSNLIAGKGFTAIFTSLSKNSSITELQLRHQGKNCSSAEEDALAGLMAENTTLCKLGIDVRSTKAQTDLARKVAQNADARRAALHKEKQQGPQKKKGKWPVFFEKVAKNDASITEVEIVGDLSFKSMKRADRLEVAASFAGNTHIKTAKLVNVELDDDFGKALGPAIESCHVEKLLLDSNDLRSEGIKAIIEGLGKNKTIIECQLRHQKKPMDTASEEKLGFFLQENESITKLGIDLRSPTAQREVDKVLRRNRDLVRKTRKRANSVG